ncbi:MAG: hypothetical protein COA78_15890 [Blastopirellula sp.]|nr:MAG: hypothetical protein COA78_15890 [Blastopirellula sp.]
MYRCLSILALLLLTNICVAEINAPAMIKIQAGQHDREDSIVRVELPKSFIWKESYTLKTNDGALPLIPCQKLEENNESFLLFRLQSPLKSGQSRGYLLVEQKHNKQEKVLAIQEKQLTLEFSGKPILRYNTAYLDSPDPKQPYFGRSGFIHPLYDPAGHETTDDFPADHLHQHGIMFPWTKTSFRGHDIDFWNSKLQQGKVEHRQLLKTISGPVVGGFDASLAHIDITSDEPVDVLNETWQVRVYPSQSYHLIEITSTQTCATKDPLNIKKYHYGGMAFRGNALWLNNSISDFLTSEGKTRKDGNHTQPAWVDTHGLLENIESGVTIIPHPSNFRYPQPVRLHPSKPYFCFTPQVESGFQIKPGTPYVSKYRYVVRTGTFDAKLTDRLYKDYADPIKAKFIQE